MELDIQSLSKTYPNGVRALKNVSLQLSSGMFGLLGPNGAGKSTLMRILATLQEADGGAVFLDGRNLSDNKMQVRRILGYLPQEFGVYPGISAEKMLDHTARLKGIGKHAERKALIAALLENVNLTKDKAKPLTTYSGGMKQRFGIAQALIGNPRLIIVDEPTAGLDPGERNRLYNLLSRIGQNTIVILSTHIVEDISTLCSKFAIINKGEVIYTGEPETAIRDMEHTVFSKYIEKAELATIGERHKVVSARLRSGKLEVRVFSETDPGHGFVSCHPTLEDVYFKKLPEDDSLFLN